MKNLLLILLLFPVFLFSQTTRPITVDDLWQMKRITSYDVSPDRSLIVFAVSTYEMENNSGDSDIYTIGADGNDLKKILDSDVGEVKPQFTPDGKNISFLMNSQLYTSDLNGENIKQLTDIYSGITNYEWSEDGSKLLFSSMVYPDCKTQECNEKRDNKKNSSKVKAEIFSELMYRHWDDWRTEKRSHLFLFDISSNEYKDLTENYEEDVPTLALGSSNDFNLSPIGNLVAFTTNPEMSKAYSTNNEIYLGKINENLFDDNVISESKGNDSQPVFSPDGQWIAFASMKREGFEADQKNILLYNISTGETKNLTEDFDLSVDEIIWSPDMKYIYFTAGNKIYNSIYRLDVEEEETELFYKENYNTKIQISDDGSYLYFLKQRSDLPNEIFSISTDGRNNLKQITHLNEELLSQLEMNSVETFWSKGAGGTEVQSILLKPPFFDPQKKYPMIFLIHGGPQGAWEDNFHYRWNLQLFGSKGYVVVAPNPRGSTGYGQQFTDEISKDWGGKVYTDLMNAYDYAVDHFDFIDDENTFAAGASYGGYMINWIAGHTDRFNALVSHDGVFNLESMYGTTEELWFPEWEFGGTPWESREIYEKWSPHRYIHNAKTPMLIIHGAKDFRVSEEQAFQLFTSLQRLGVESKFLYYPDETHFVTKPHNARLWWNTIFDWYDSHLKQE